MAAMPDEVGGAKPIPRANRRNAPVLAIIYNPSA